MEKSIILSINLVKERISDILNIFEDKKNNLIPKENYYYDSLKLKLIEIGEECKIINDILKENENHWDDIISKQYHFRISLTHFYKNMANKKIDIFMENQFEVFVSKINELEIKYKKLNSKKGVTKK